MSAKYLKNNFEALSDDEDLPNSTDLKTNHVETIKDKVSAGDGGNAYDKFDTNPASSKQAILDEELEVEVANGIIDNAQAKSDNDHLDAQAATNSGDEDCGPQEGGNIIDTNNETTIEDG